MQTYDLLKITNTQPNYKGSESGYTNCPLCKGEKLFARGRGINTHLRSKHKDLTVEKFTEIAKLIETLPVQWKTTKIVELDKGKYLQYLGIQNARDNDQQNLKLLVQNGWNPLTQDKNGSNALHWSSGQGHFEIVKYLIEEHKLDPSNSYKEKDGRTPMHWASRNGQIQIVQYFLDLGVNVDILTKDGTTPLHLAAYGGSVEAVKFLVQKGANLSHMNNYQCTVAHWVAMGGSAAVGQLLLEMNVDFMAKQKEGQNAMHKASVKGHLEFIQTILDEIDNQILKEKDNSGYMPYELAEMQGHFETKKFLQQKTKLKRIKF